MALILQILNGFLYACIDFKFEWQICGKKLCRKKALKKAVCFCSFTCQNFTAFLSLFIKPIFIIRGF